MVQAGLSSCGSAQPAPESQSPEPPITTKASEAPTAEPASTAEQEEAPPEYMPATKSGAFLPRPQSRQKNAPAK
jgi:hypothetical protein